MTSAAPQPGCRHQAVHVLLVVAKANKSNVCRLQKRPSRADAGELGNAAGQVEHVGDAHRVEDRFVWMVGRDHEVLATVDIDQANFAVMLDQRCHQRDGQGALSAEHQRCLASENHLGDGGARSADHVDDLPPRIRPLVGPLGGPPGDREVAVVGDPNAVRADCLQEPGLPQRCGTLLDSGPMGGNARRHTEHAPRTGPGFGVTRHSHTLSSGRQALVFCT